MSHFGRLDAQNTLGREVAPCAILPEGEEELHRTLARFNKRRLSPGLQAGDWRKGLADEMRHRGLEMRMIEEERARITEQAAAAPSDAEGFLAWFEALERTGPGQHDPLFPWLAEAATLEEMRWFLWQEVAGEAGFEDLVAMTQVKLPTRAKLELARNYWDEMGRGQELGMHGPMLGRLAEELSLTPVIDDTVWEALALGNVMVGLAANRSYAYHSVGALGVIELTAPGRAKLVSDGLRRLGIEGKARHYFDLHAVLDVKHSEAWNREIVGPLVAAEPATARAMAEGALMRLACGQRCFERYRAELWGKAKSPSPESGKGD